jgi:hypothetical protein
MRVQLLGSVGVIGSDRQVVALSGERERTLLATLALGVGRPVSASRLTEGRPPRPPRTTGPKSTSRTCARGSLQPGQQKASNRFRTGTRCRRSGRVNSSNRVAPTPMHMDTPWLEQRAGAALVNSE